MAYTDLARQKEMSQKWRLANIEKVRGYHRKAYRKNIQWYKDWYARNRDKKLAYTREYHQKFYATKIKARITTPEAKKRKNAVARKWRLANAEHMRAYHKGRYAKNRQWYLDYYQRNRVAILAYHRARYQERKLDQDIDWKCVGCGKVETQSPTLLCRPCRRATCIRCQKPFLVAHPGQRVHGKCTSKIKDYYGQGDLS